MTTGVREPRLLGAATLAELRRGIGPDEGGVRTPYGGNGVFHLPSM